MNDQTYHERVRGEKRAAAVQAAKELFLGQGYSRTSLQHIAKLAGVSTATLFKRFPTKASLFKAIVEDFWAVDEACSYIPPTENPGVGLRKIGLNYAHRMRHPEMLSLFRLIVSEVIEFPDLGQMLYDRGVGPYLLQLEHYLEAETRAQRLNVNNPSHAARQFLAMVAGQAVWPELMVAGCGGTDDEMAVVVDEAVAATMARYGNQAFALNSSTPAK